MFLPKKGQNMMRALLLLSQLGLTIALPIFGGVLLGSRLDRQLGTGGRWTIILMILGVIGGFSGGYRLLKTAMEEQDGKKKD